MKFIAFDLDLDQLSIGYLTCLVVVATIKPCMDLQAWFCCGGPNQIDDYC